LGRILLSYEIYISLRKPYDFAISRYHIMEIFLHLIPYIVIFVLRCEQEATSFDGTGLLSMQKEKEGSGWDLNSTALFP
jgi:hypothetical protein